MALLSKYQLPSNLTLLILYRRPVPPPPPPRTPLLSLRGVHSTPVPSKSTLHASHPFLKLSFQHGRFFSFKTLRLPSSSYYRRFCIPPSHRSHIFLQVPTLRIHTLLSRCDSPLTCLVLCRLLRRHANRRSFTCRLFQRGCSLLNPGCSLRENIKRFWVEVVCARSSGW